MGYVMLSNKRLKQRKNQILHIQDGAEKTFCQTENMQRKRLPKFLHMEKSEGRPVCKVCLAERDKAYYEEPRLSVLMGERMNG